MSDSRDTAEQAVDVESGRESDIGSQEVIFKGLAMNLTLKALLWLWPSEILQQTELEERGLSSYEKNANLAKSSRLQALSRLYLL